MRSTPLAAVALCVLAAGCAETATARELAIDLIPQNHSGRAYELEVKILEGGKAFVTKSFTLGPSDHVGRAVEIEFRSGTYQVHAAAQRSQAGGVKRVEHSETVTFPASSQSLTVIIGSSEGLDFLLKA